MTTTAPELFASAWNTICTGEDKCHWCGSPCNRLWPHTDTLPLKGKNATTALYPANGFICNGCWLIRRPKVTLYYLDETWKDGQAVVNHSCWITAEEVRIIKESNYRAVYNKLLNPPNEFCLALLQNAKENLLHRAVVNTVPIIQADTKLFFTLDNVVYSYTVYDLTAYLQSNTAGKSPGVTALVNLLGKYDMPPKPEQGRGRPPANENQPKKVIQKSGS